MKDTTNEEKGWEKTLEEMFDFDGFFGKNSTTKSILFDFIAQEKERSYAEGQKNPTVGVEAMYGYDAGFSEALRLVSEKFKDYEEFEDLSIKEIRATIHSLQEEGK